MISRQAAFFILADCIERFGGSIARIAAKARGEAPPEEGEVAGAKLAGSRHAMRREAWTADGPVELLSLDRGATWFAVRSRPDGTTVSIEPAGADLLDAEDATAVPLSLRAPAPRPTLKVANAEPLPARPVTRAFAVVGAR